MKLLIIAFLACSALATTRNVSCSGTITSSLQSAVNSSIDGDTVSIGAGSCTSGKITWTNKNIAIIGQGIDATTITMTAGGFAITVTNPAKAAFRLSGMTITGSSSSDHILFINSENCTSYSYGWRVDHIKFNYSGAVSNDPITGWGVTFGLFDHNVFQFANATWILFAYFQTGLGELTWGSPAVNEVGGWYNLSLPSQYGTSNAIYFEDNTFTNLYNNYSAFYDTSSGGSRVVFRYNTFTGGFIYNHWVRGNDLDVFQWEVYNNKFVGNSTWGQGGGEIAVRFESGTGVFFNNTFTGWSTGNQAFYVDDRRACGGEDGGQFGSCDGSHAWDGNDGDPSAPGWPCLAQIGRGFGKTYSQITSGNKLPSLPAYAWNNGTQEKCWNLSASGAVCSDSVAIEEYYGSCAYVKSAAHPNGEKDFVNNGATAMPGYSSYAYPHPLQGSGAAPTITSTSPLPVGTVGTAYSQTLTATGDATITWAVTSGSLPAGLSLSSGGAITGTPTTAGTSTPTITATNGTGSDGKVLSITINAAPSGPTAGIAGKITISGKVTIK